MTQQDDITQRVPTAEHHLNELMRLTQPWPNATIPCATVRSHVEQALSKLRAPVADERDRNATISQVVGLCNRIPGATTWNAAQFMYDEMHRRAALASAPVAPQACPTDVCQAGQQDGVLCANDECDRANGVRPASAPVAGEPFMYGIMGPDGKAHFEEFCVSGDRDELQAEVVDHLNRDNPEDGSYSVVALFRDAAPRASVEAFDFVAHLARQAEFSARTFGPGARVAGVCDHIRKELIEVETSGGDLKEWVDVIILGLDGAWRSGATPQEIIAAIVAKQAKNEARTWPDWRTVDPNKAIEHQRTAAPCTCPSGDGSLRHLCPMHPGVDKDGGQQRNWVSDWSAAIKSLPMGRADAEGIRSPSNACMHRNECRAMLDRQQRAGDECKHARAHRAGDRQGYACPDCGEFVSDYEIHRRKRAALSAPQAEQGERDA